MDARVRSGPEEVVGEVGRRPVIVVCGGADELGDAGVLGRAVAGAAAATGAAVVDGGTDAGVMAEIGRRRRERPDAFAALVGVAPAALVGPEEDRVPLEPNHTHFVLAEGSEWGAETGLLFDVAAALARRAVVVVAGGGDVTLTEVREAVRRGWPVFVIEGTGGTADAIAAVVRTKGARDAELARTVDEGRIQLFKGSEPGQLARRLSWELQDESALKAAWATFAGYDKLAGRLRRSFELFQRSILALGILGTFLALLYNAVGGAWLHWVVVATPIVVAVMIGLANVWAAGKRWVLLRAAAESVKAEIYRYRTRTGAYRAGDRPWTLVTALNAIEARLLQTEASGAPLPPYTGALPPDMYGAGRDDDGLVPLDPDRYLAIRVADQLSYYHGRIAELNRRRRVLQVVAVVAGGAGTLLAAAGAEIWIGLTTALSGGALSYLAMLQVENTIVVYNQSASRLAALRRTWNELSESERDFDKLVADAESVLASELGGWVQQMNAALEELQAKQAKQTKT